MNKYILHPPLLKQLHLILEMTCITSGQAASSPRHTICVCPQKQTVGSKKSSAGLLSLFQLTKTHRVKSRIIKAC